MIKPNKSLNFKVIKDEYTQLLDTMSYKNSSWALAFQRTAKKIAAGAPLYIEISNALGGHIPWQFIGVIHNLESGCDFSKHLHNGDSLKKRTWQVPANRPPTHFGPFTFFESAVDALQMKGFDKISDWSPERMCYELEKYNGWGYRQYRGHQSPYLWSGTNHYVKGKYTSDGSYDSKAVSKQAGAVPVLKVLLDMNSTVAVQTPPEALTPKEVVNNSTKLTLLSRINRFIEVAVSSIAGLFTLDNFMNLKLLGGDMTEKIGVPQLAVFVSIILGVYVLNKYLTAKSVDDAKKGNYTPSGIAK